LDKADYKSARPLSKKSGFENVYKSSMARQVTSAVPGKDQTNYKPITDKLL